MAQTEQAVARGVFGAPTCFVGGEMSFGQDQLEFVPVLEVHMSNEAASEAWRVQSIISPAVRATIQGPGWRLYAFGLRALVDLVREGQSGR